jgi:hypothetical protein
MRFLFQPGPSRPRRLTSLLGIAALGSFVALAAPACNSSSGGGGSGTGAFCSAITSYVSRCSLTTVCDQEEVANCTTIGAAFSTAYVDAVTSCLSQAACDSVGQAASSACIQGKTLASAPSAAAEKLAQDYCTPCAGLLSISACVSGFYSSSVDGGGALGGVGDSLLELNDATLEKVDSTCIPPLAADAGLASCTFGFDECEYAIVQASIPAQPSCSTSNDAGTVPVGDN